METTIFRKAKGYFMAALFNADSKIFQEQFSESRKLNIRHISANLAENEEYSIENEYLWNITIRHSEHDNPDTIFDSCYKYMYDNLTRALYVSPSKKGHTAKDVNYCECCGKKIVNEEKMLWVHMNTDWLAVNPLFVNEENCTILTGADSQGCFAVGQDCANFMKHYTFK